MQKIIFAFILLAPIMGYNQKISLAPEIGSNVIPMTNSNIGQNYQLGYHFGGHLKYHFSKKFKLSTGVFLTNKKKNYAYSTTSSALSLFNNLLNGFGDLGGGTNSSDLDSILSIPGLNTEITESTRGTCSELFIEIPVLANYKVQNVNFYLGPYISLLISANRKEEITTEIPLFDVIDIDSLMQINGGGFGGLINSFLPQSGKESYEKSGTTGLRTLDFGINAGIGYEMNNLHFNFMYSHGLLDYRDDNKEESTETLKLFRISIAYFFDLGKKSSTNNSSFN